MTDEREPAWDDFPSPEEPYDDAVSGRGGLRWLLLGSVASAALGAYFATCRLDPIVHDDWLIALLLAGLATFALLCAGWFFELVHGTSRWLVCVGATIVWYVGFSLFGSAFERCGF
jgi:hypothetical protein